MLYRLIPAAVFCVLTACGGGGSSGSGPSGRAAPLADVVPLSTSGFAGTDLAPDGVIRFVVPDLTRVVSDGTADLAFDSQTIRMSYLPDSEDITVQIAGRDYLVRFDTDQGVFYYNAAADRIVLRFLSNVFDVVSSAELFSVIDDNLNTSHLVVGFDSDPGVVDARDDIVSYSGQADVALRRGFDDGFGSGNFTMDVNFLQNRLSGSAAISDSGSVNSDVILDDFVVSFNETSIRQNGFEGRMTLQSGDLGGTLRAGAYQGRFFDEEAGSIGAQFSGRIDHDDSGPDTFLEGVFVGNDTAIPED